MNCEKCGCELTEGYSKFCPECGTPVNIVETPAVRQPIVIKKRTENTRLKLAFRIVLGVLVVISAIWIFFPLLRAPGKEITTLSAFDLIIGKKNFDGMKIGAVPALAIFFILPHIFCLSFTFVKRLDIHKLYAIIGITELYKAIVSVCIWALIINICNSYMQGEYAYGIGFVIDILFSMFTAFFCISLSASQKNDTARNHCWLTTVGIFNLCLMAAITIITIAGFVMISLLRDILPCTVLIILSAISGIWAYYNIVKKDFSQWLVMLIHTVVTLAAHITLLFYANVMVNDFAGNNDFLDIIELGSVYINTIVIGITVFSLIYNTAITVWTYKTLKHPSK